jgi:hypothetical protein
MIAEIHPDPRDRQGAIAQITRAGMVLARSSYVSMHKGFGISVVVLFSTLSTWACTQPYPESYRGSSRASASDGGVKRGELPEPADDVDPVEVIDSGSSSSSSDPPAADGGAGIDVCSCAGPGIPFPECPAEKPKGCPGS